MKSIRKVALCTAVLVAAVYFVRAQTAADLSDQPVLTAPNADVSNLSDEEVALRAIEMMPPIPASSLPRFGGTYWSAQHSLASAEPWPPLPGDTMGLGAWQLDQSNVFLINDLAINYDAVRIHHRHRKSSSSSSLSADTQVSAMDDSSGPPSFDDTNDDDYTPDDVTNTPIAIDYGTNLWIAQWNLISNSVTGIASNTIADVQYDILTNSDLTTTNWGDTGLSFIGSAITNWTPLPALSPVSLTNNLFFRLQSQASSDNSGVPDWWELQNFGATGLNVNAPDGAGDGWTIYQKYVLGVNPNTFYTPPAPQGLTATYNVSTTTANISWLPSPGNVTGYTLTTPNGNVINLSASATSYVDSGLDLSSNLAQTVDWSPYISPATNTTFDLVADYIPGPSAHARANIVTANFPAIWLVQGTLGSNFLAAAISALPPDTTAIRFTRFDNLASEYGNDQGASTDIPLSDFTNGLFYLPPELTTAPADGFAGNFVNFNWVAQAVNSNSTPISPANLLGRSFGPSNGPIESASTLLSQTSIYLDGRVQLKQNLKFLLRAATVDNSFGYYTLSGDYQFFSFGTPRTFSTGYVEASFYQNQYLFDYSYYPENPPILDSFQPFEDNYLYENCVFNSSLLNAGQLTTGVFPQGYNWFDDYMIFSNTLAYTFNAPTVSGTPVAALGPDQATWLMTGENAFDFNYCYEIGMNLGSPDNYNPTNVLLSTNNIFGLPILSVKAAWNDNNGNLQMQTLYPGDGITQTKWLYPQTAQPGLQTVEYDFWNYGYYDANFNLHQADTLPEESGFSPTNQSDNCLIVPLGSTLQVAGYAKMAVTNGYPGVYGYVGQYFTNAYVIGTNGIATTNTTGILSPFGAFFPTQPGPVALVTMPDPDTGQQGTCTVYVVSLALDKNHDGTMDLSLFGADATSQNSPFVFWANNNFDRLFYDADDATNYMDDVADNYSTALDVYGHSVPDCNYTNYIAAGYGQRTIPTTRDLEDFARLWVCGVTTNLLANLPMGSTVTLNWGDMGSPNSANPTIDLFTAADADGGIGYLTNETSAANQINPGDSLYLGRLGPGQSIQLNASQPFQLDLPYNWQGNHYIWCGVANGSGQLNLTITDSNGIVLAQTSQWIQIMDIKQMYERWTVGDDVGTAPTNVASLATDNLPPSLQANPVAFQYPSSTDTNTPYILFVHGWNMESWAKDRFAETAYKRLYWQGYQGRFGLFRWPTGNGFNGTLIDAILQPHNYDGSEYNAWQSGQGLMNKLNDLNAKYSGHVYLLAHSMGNVVAGEALRLAAQNGLGQIVNTYVASQAAIPAHVYDASVTSPYLINYSYYAHSLPAPGQPRTPNIYGNRLTNNAAAVERRISFYNVNDFALNADAWCWDQEHKPDYNVLISGVLWAYAYNGSTNDPAPWNNFYKIDPDTSTNAYLDIVNNTLQKYEVLAYAANPYSTALGATPGITNFVTVDMTDPNNRVWLSPDPLNNDYKSHYWHSAQFRGDTIGEWGYWNEFLGADGANLK